MRAERRTDLQGRLGAGERGRPRGTREGEGSGGARSRSLRELLLENSWRAGPMLSGLVHGVALMGITARLEPPPLRDPRRAWCQPDCPTFSARGEMALGDLQHLHSQRECDRGGRDHLGPLETGT